MARERISFRASKDCGLLDDIYLGFGGEPDAPDVKIGYDSTNNRLVIEELNTTVARQIRMDFDIGTNSGEIVYIRGTTSGAATSVTAVRARGMGAYDGVATSSITGVHAQGIANDGLQAGTVNALYAEAIAKGTSTVTTLRGAMIVADSEGTPTAITDMIGCHVRVKTSVAPGGVHEVMRLETQEFGVGRKCDSMLRFVSTTWAAGDEGIVAIIDMSGVTCKAEKAHIRFPLAAMDNDSSTEGDFWYDSVNNVFKFYNGSAVRTITDS